MRNSLVVTWPEGLKDVGGPRSQFGRVNDIVPTLLGVIGIEAPSTVNGIAQTPLNGVSRRYAFDAPQAPEQHRTQYSEVFGHCSIYHDGWSPASTTAPVPGRSAVANRIASASVNDTTKSSAASSIA